MAGVRRALKGMRVPSAGQTVLVGFSGGPDSVALLDALVVLGRSQGFEVVAAHLDHRLRPDSAEDVDFCQDLCRRLAVPLRVGVADVRGRGRREKKGIEDAARQERYAFLRRLRAETGAVAIAVAHTQDDQAETVLLHLLRGAGRPGLSAMRPRAGDIIRPLLAVSRDEVLAHLRERQLGWRQDPTNTDPAFLRNRVRLELLPYLEARFNPRVRETLAQTANLLTEESESLERAGQQIFERSAAIQDGGVSLSLTDLLQTDRSVARLALRRALAATGDLIGISARHVDRILEVAASAAPSGHRLALPGDREAQFRFDRVWIGPRIEHVALVAQELPVPGVVDLPGGLRIVAHPAEARPVAGGDGSLVPADQPLEVRTRRPGDRVIWKGRHRSLRRFLMERRIPADRREDLPLIASGSEVLWIPGQPTGPRTAERYARVSIESTASGAQA